MGSLEDIEIKQEVQLKLEPVSTSDQPSEDIVTSNFQTSGVDAALNSSSFDHVYTNEPFVPLGHYKNNFLPFGNIPKEESDILENVSFQNYFNCKECEFVSSEKAELRYHYKLKHSYISHTSREYKCPHCDSSYSTNNHLVRHVRAS